MKSTVNGGQQALHGLAPKLNGLAPKRANSASVRRRKTNDPSMESLSSCGHEELAIDDVRAPRATQAVLEPGAIIYTLEVPTAAPYSSMQAWIGVHYVMVFKWQPFRLCHQALSTEWLSWVATCVNYDIEEPGTAKNYKGAPLWALAGP